MVVSVDVPVLGRRLNEYRNNFTLPEQLAFPNIVSTGHDEFTRTEGPNSYGQSFPGDIGQRKSIFQINGVFLQTTL